MHIMRNKNPELDRFDYAILERLQENTTTPLRAISDQINLSIASVQRRVRRMEEIGVIQANIAVIDPTKIGLPITILVEVHAERTHLEDLIAMKTHLSGPEVQQCYYVTGDADFVLVVTVATMADYEALATRLFYENKNVKWFRSIVVMDRVKVGLTLPISET
jgi:Lrp/AsnC family transcriptional regulator, leucine-responsive regulatory protein